MFRCSSSIKQFLINIDTFAVNYTLLQTVRWRRKPCWLPMAKSKLFKIAPRPVLPPDDKQELQRLFNNYRTHIKTIRKYLREKYSIDNENTDTALPLKLFSEDFARCTEINSHWNAEQKLVREARIAKETEQSVEQAKQRLATRIAINQEKLLTAEEIVKREKELAKDFVTPETLEAAIEYAMNNPVDYNFAIDLEGNRIIGRESKPSVKDEKIQLKQ